jgi:hypothetical protein
MKKEFVIYPLALRMKALGFDEPCFMYWWKGENDYILADLIDGEARTNDFKAPTFSQAFRWFREKHGLYGIPEERTLNNFSYQIKSNKEGAITFIVYGGYPLNFESYEEAELACLEKLIEIVEQTNAEMTEHGVYK